MATRTSGAIALRPTGNAQGGYYFLSLHSWKSMVHNNWTVLPMPAEVIATVHQLAYTCKKYKGIVFTDKHGNIITDTLTLDGNDEITGVHACMDDITGVDDDDNVNENANGDADESTGVRDESTGVRDESTGVHKNNENDKNEDNDDNDDTTHKITNDNENENINDNENEENEYDMAHEAGGINKNNTAEDDDISIEIEDHNDNHVTIDDLNIIEYMNAAQLNTDPKTGNHVPEDGMEECILSRVQPQTTTNTSKQ